jgi:transaldolase/glucose-6-phosphate isomerase
MAGTDSRKTQMDNSIQRVNELGQSFWYDNIRRGLIEAGELKRLIDLGVSGLTSNPTIFEKAIAGSTDYDSALLELATEGKSATEIYEDLVMEDIRAAADLLRPVYERTDGADGYASLEVSPLLAHDTEATYAQATRLFAALDRPNVMIKVPATPEGIPAVRRLIGEGLNINITLTFSLAAYQNVREAYLAGLENLDRSGGDVARVASVASFFVSRVDTLVDSLLEEAASERDTAGRLFGKAAIANAKLAYRDFRGDFDGERFASLKARGAHVQRPLWASTSTKNPAYSDVMYVESLIGPDTVDTLPEATLAAFLEHGGIARTLDKDVDSAEAEIEALEEAGISMEQVTEKLLADGVKSFADSFDQLMGNLEEKRARLLGEDRGRAAGAGTGPPDAEATLADLQKRDVTGRIWRRDHTVWKPGPDEIENRLGWLDVSRDMGDQVEALQDFSQQVRGDGVRRVVLLGMGGSSLGPEVFNRAFGGDTGFPELTVLDSTVPAWVQAVTDDVEPSRTLFVVSSKSGSTIEPNALYKHFRHRAERAVGESRAGQHFVAITDEGTTLERLAREQEFRHVFLNPQDIGGRFSVLSYFGLVPAALIGVDLSEILRRADSMRDACGPGVSPQDNPGARLGATMAALALGGRDKLTLIASPSIAGFGLWVEQLIAESTGKEGTGIVPVAGEPLLAPASYGDDRFFVYLRSETDDNAANDAAIAALESYGQPVMRLDLRDRYDLGAEFFRWQFATSVAGSLLGINPFDQPDVRRAKEQTESLLREYESSRALPRPELKGSVHSLLSTARGGEYLAIMAFVRPTAETDDALALLRRRVMERYHVATTMGYGPRFLHSTGQLHKGGAGNGLFLQLTADHPTDVEIPGQPYTFGVLSDAQALGDLTALEDLDRRVAAVHLGAEVGPGIAGLVSEVG